MDKTELTEKCLEWEQCMRRAKELEADIIPAVLALGETYKAGNVTAKHRAGAVQNDWETPGRTAPLAIIGKHTT